MADDTPGVGGNDPDGERAAFLERVRADARALGSGETLEGTEPKPGPRASARQAIAVFSAGNSHEAHGPALAPDIDDRIGQSIAIRICERTGARYLGHIDGETDGIGLLAQRWSPGVVAPDDYLDALVDQVQSRFEVLESRPAASRPRIVAIVSGHGGNRVVGERAAELADRLGVEIVLYIPAIRVARDDGPPAAPQHAGAEEHAAALYLGPGYIDAHELDRVNASMTSDAGLFEAMQRFPALGGMAGFYIFGSPPFDAIRRRYRGVKAAVASMLEMRRIDATREQGREIVTFSVTLAASEIEDAAAALEISLEG